MPDEAASAAAATESLARYKDAIKLAVNARRILAREIMAFTEGLAGGGILPDTLSPGAREAILEAGVRRAMGEMREFSVHLENRAADMEKDLRTLAERALDGLRADAEAKDAELLRLHREEKEWAWQSESLRGQCDANCEALRALEDAVSEYERKISSLTQETNRLQDESADLHKLEDAVFERDRKIASLTQDNREMQDRIDRLVNENRRLIDEKEKLKDENDRKQNIYENIWCEIQNVAHRYFPRDDEIAGGNNKDQGEFSQQQENGQYHTTFLHSKWLETVRRNGEELRYVPEELRTYEICLEAVKQNEKAIDYVPQSLRHDVIRHMERGRYNSAAERMRKIRDWIDRIKGNAGR